MLRRVLAIGLLAAHAAPVALVAQAGSRAQIGPASPPFRESAAFVIDPPRVGPIAIGMTIDALYEQVGRDRTRLVDEFQDGLFGPVLHLSVEGGTAPPPALVVGIRPRDTGFFVGGVLVHDSRFSTSDGIRVGIRLGDLPRVAWPAMEHCEQGPCLVLRDQGLTLGLEEPAGVDLVRGDIAPPGARVRTIYVWGAPANPP